MAERKEWISPLAHLALTPLMRRALCIEAAERLRGPRREGAPVEGLKERVAIVAPTKSATKSATNATKKAGRETTIRRETKKNLSHETTIPDGETTIRRGRPMSERPWEAEGISRATWNRRRAAKREES